MYSYFKRKKYVYIISLFSFGTVRLPNEKLIITFRNTIHIYKICSPQQKHCVGQHHKCMFFNVKWVQKKFFQCRKPHLLKNRNAICNNDISTRAATSYIILMVNLLKVILQRITVSDDLVCHTTCCP